MGAINFPSGSGLGPYLSRPAGASPLQPTLLAQNGAPQYDRAPIIFGNTNTLSTADNIVVQGDDGTGYVDLNLLAGDAFSGYALGLTANITGYKVRVVARKAGSADSAFSNEYVFNTPVAPPVGLFEATNVSADQSGSNIEVTWTNNSIGQDTVQVQRRAVNYASPNAWADIGTQIVGAESYTDTAPIIDTAMQYRVVDTLTAVTVESATDTAWTQTLPLGIVETGTEVTVTNGPMVTVLSKTAGTMTIALGAETVVSNLTAQAEFGGTVSAWAAPSEVVTGSHASHPHHVHLADIDGVAGVKHYRDFGFTEGKSLIHFLPFSKSWITGNPEENYFSAAYATRMVEDFNIRIDSPVISATPNTHIQLNPYSSTNSLSGARVVDGNIHDGANSGGWMKECHGNGSDAFYWSQGSAGQDLWVEYFLESPTDCDTIVMDVAEPSADNDYSSVLNTLQVEINHATGQHVTVSATQVANGTFTISDNFATGYEGVTSIRILQALQESEQRMLFGPLRLEVASSTVATVTPSKLSDEAVDAKPLSVSILGLHRMSPIQVSCDAAGIDIKSAMSSAPQRATHIYGHGSAPVLDIGIALDGSATAVHKAPTTITQPTHLTDALFCNSNLGDNALMDALHAYALPDKRRYDDRDAMQRRWMSHGESMLSAPYVNTGNGSIVTFQNSALQGAQQDTALKHFLQYQDDATYHEFLYAMQFIQFGMTCGQPYRNKHNGHLPRKNDRNFSGVLQAETLVDYGTGGPSLAWLYEFTGVHMYDELEDIAIGGHAHWAKRSETVDAGRISFVANCDRPMANLAKGLLEGIQKHGWGANPRWGGQTPDNPNGAVSEDPIEPADTWGSLLLTHLGTLLTPIEATPGARKFLGLASNGETAQYNSNQPVWGIWHVAPLIEIHAILVTQGETAMAGRLEAVLVDTLDESTASWIQGTGASTQFAYRLDRVGDVHSVTGSNNSRWTASYESQNYGSFFAGAYAAGFAWKPARTDWRDISIDLMDAFKAIWQSQDMGERQTLGWAYGGAKVAKEVGGLLTV